MGLFATIRHVFSINIPLRSNTTATIISTDDTIQEVAKEEEINRFAAMEQVDVNPNSSEDSIGNATTCDAQIPDSAYADTSENTDIDTSLVPSSQLQHNGHRIIGVHSWSDAFPDIQPVQLAAAKRNGIPPCATRGEAQRLVRKRKLVNICHSPLYVVDDLTHSMPYLVPKAQHLLNTICLNFIDSLQCKGMPLHLPVVTSVLRTTSDVSSLQRGNKNATTNSCHCYGTTVDITYNRFMPLVGHYNSSIEPTRWSLEMKQVMAEVLRDLREQKLCYVKYEYKQACFHLTVR